MQNDTCTENSYSQTIVFHMYGHTRLFSCMLNIESHVVCHVKISLFIEISKKRIHPYNVQYFYVNYVLINAMI